MQQNSIATNLQCYLKYFHHVNTNKVPLIPTCENLQSILVYISTLVLSTFNIQHRNLDISIHYTTLNFGIQTKNF